MSKKLPALHFYPGDWFKDPGIMALNCEERGVWFQILLLMFESNRRGFLELGGEAYPTKLLLKVLEVSPKKLEKTIEKLIKFSIVSVEENTKILFNRRMIRDEELRESQSNGGVKGSDIKKKKLSTPKQKKEGLSEDESEVENEDKDLKDNEGILSDGRKAMQFESRWLAYEGEKDNKKIALGYWKGKVKTEKDVADYDQAVINYYAIVAADRKNGFPDRRLKGGKTWFNNYESYIDQKPPAQKSKDGMQQQKQLQEKELKAYCVKQLDFVQRDLAEGEDRSADWFYAALDKRVLEYEQRFGYSPFDEEQNENYQSIREEMMGETE